MDIPDYLSITDGAVYARDGGVIGWTEKGRAIEVDLRSGEKEERRIRFNVDGMIQKSVIVGVPRNVQFGVCLIYAYTSICLYPFSYSIRFLSLCFLRTLELDLFGIRRQSVKGRERWQEK